MRGWNPQSHKSNCDRLTNDIHSLLSLFVPLRQNCWKTDLMSFDCWLTAHETSAKVWNQGFQITQIDSWNQHCICLRSSPRPSTNQVPQARQARQRPNQTLQRQNPPIHCFFAWFATCQKNTKKNSKELTVEYGLVEKEEPQTNHEKQPQSLDQILLQSRKDDSPSNKKRLLSNKLSSWDVVPTILATFEFAK